MFRLCCDLALLACSARRALLPVLRRGGGATGRRPHTSRRRGRTRRGTRNVGDDTHHSVENVGEALAGRMYSDSWPGTGANFFF